MKKIIHRVRFALLTSITALMLVGTAFAQNEGTAKGGGQKLIAAKQIKTSKDITAVKTGDIVTSTCPMCKETSYKRIDTAKGGAAGLQSGTAGGAKCSACNAKASASGR